MAKIIELCSYRKNRPFIKKAKDYSISPIWFYELNDGINNLALKHKDIIISNVKEQLLNKYYTALNIKNTTENLYPIEVFLTDTINLKDPFSISHGVQFARNHYLSMISSYDWENITDIIIRICINNTFNIMDPFGPKDIAKDYLWTSVLINLPNTFNDK